jgi:hypothetical protein
MLAHREVAPETTGLYFFVQAMSDKLSSPIVFSHNDLLSGNFMYNEEEG